MMVPRPHDYEATCEAVHPLTPDIQKVVLKLETSEPFHFRAGQFINLTVPRPEGGRPLYRSYSIGSPHDASDGRLTLYVDTDVMGPGSILLTGLKPGDRVKFKGPLGIFHLKEPSDRPMLIVTHISALGVCFRMAEAAIAETPNRTVTLIAEVKQEDHLFLQREMLELARRAPHFHHVLTCSSGTPTWSGPRRTLLEEALRRLPDPPDVEVYICGLGSMVVSVKEGLKQAGVLSSLIHGEKWSKADKIEGKNEQADP